MGAVSARNAFNLQGGANGSLHGNQTLARMLAAPFRSKTLF